MYVYIYLYICVCVCVSAQLTGPSIFIPRDRKQREANKTKPQKYQIAYCYRQRTLSLEKNIARAASTIAFGR